MTTTEIMPATLESAHHAAHQSAVWLDRSRLGMLKFSGETRLDLINRMSTQKVLGLQSGQGTATVLTTDIGRIIDRLLLYASSDTVYCLTGENNNETIASYLVRFVFFMDDFQIEDLSAETTILAVYGCQAEQILGRLFGEEAVELPLHHWRQLELEGHSVYLHRTDPVAGDGYFVMADSADRPFLVQQLAAAGIEAIDEQAFDYLRIESGLPRFGQEMTEDYIPLETNLWEDVSFNKGCYTGQEIIARMESRGRLAKKLVRLQADSPLQVGEKISANGKSVGTITSTASGPAGVLALGYVKTAALEAESPLFAGDKALQLR